MKKLSYLRYFIYLAYNWNLRIAVHIIKQERIGEKKYGINTIGFDTLNHLRKKGVDISDATIYMPASYDMLELFLNKANLSSSKHFIDIGCGKGRALTVAAAFGATKITGLELSPVLAKKASLVADMLVKKYIGLKIRITTNDAYYYDVPQDTDVIFLFNPFNAFIMEAFAERLENSYKQNPRKITIIYLNPLHKNIFTDTGYKETFHYQKMKYLEGIMLERN